MIERLIKYNLYRQRRGVLFAMIALPLVAAGILSSCSKNEDYDSPGDTPQYSSISFIANNTGEEYSTRADNENLEPLSKYIQDFTVYGINGNLTTANGVTTFTKNDKGVVFPNYKVWYTENGASTTTSNSSDWEYVVTVGETSQTIKYWDENQNAHYFWAIGDASKGKFDDANETTFKADPDGRVASITINNVNRTATTPVFYTEPTLVKRDKDTAGDKQGDYGKPVKLVFKQLMSHIRIGFYEDFEENTSDGMIYTVTNLWFYKPRTSDGKFLKDDGSVQQSVAGTEAATAYLSGVFPQTATVQLTYNYTDAENTSSTTDPQSASSVNYLMLGNVKMPDDGKLPDNSMQSAYIMNGDSEFFNILPYENNPNTNGLTLKCDYEITTIKGNTTKKTKEFAKLATVPATYCKWKPNYSYTYIFKISDYGIVLYEVVVDDWEEGGSVDDSWHNW